MNLVISRERQEKEAGINIGFITVVMSVLSSVMNLGEGLVRNKVRVKEIPGLVWRNYKFIQYTLPLLLMKNCMIYLVSTIELARVIH